MSTSLMPNKPASPPGDGRAAATPLVTSCLHLSKPEPSGQALEKDAVLRRIRYRRRANRLRDAVRSFLQPEPPAETMDEERDVIWLDDAFSSP